MTWTPRDLTSVLRWALFTSAGQSRHWWRVLGDLVRTAVLATLAVWVILAGGLFGSLLWVQVWWVYESPDQTLRVVTSVTFGLVVGLVTGWLLCRSWLARQRAASREG